MSQVPAASIVSPSVAEAEPAADPASWPAPLPASLDALDLFMDALLLEDGLSRNPPAASRRALTARGRRPAPPPPVHVVSIAGRVSVRVGHGRRPRTGGETTAVPVGSKVRRRFGAGRRLDTTTDT